MNILAVIALAMVLGAGIFYTVQERQKAEEQRKQEQKKLNEEIEKEALKAMIGSLLRSHIARNGAFEEDSVFRAHPNPNHLRVVLDQGRARIIWEHALKGSSGSDAEAREFNDLLAEINLDIPDYRADLREETRKMMYRKMEIESQYRDLCSRTLTESEKEKIMLQVNKLNDEYEKIKKKIAINGKIIGTDSLRVAGIKRAGRDAAIVMAW